PVNAGKPFVIPDILGFKYWDIGLIGLIAISAGYGRLSIITSLTLTAATLICSAFANWFSPIRFLAGILLGLTALGFVAFDRSAAIQRPSRLDIRPSLNLAVTSASL